MAGRIAWDISDLPNAEEAKKVLLENEDAIKDDASKEDIIQKYNYNIVDPKMFPSHERLTNDIYSHQTWAFKINFSCGFLMHNNRTDEVQYYASGKLPYFPDEHGPRRIETREEWDQFLQDVNDADMETNGVNRRPDTAWTVLLMTNVTFDVYLVHRLPLGRPPDPFPDYILNREGVNALRANKKTGDPYTDNLCFWRCFALFKNNRVGALERPAKKLLKEFDPQCRPEDYTGMTINDLCRFEEKFQVNVTVYVMSDKVNISLERRSRLSHQKTLNVLLHQEHFSYINDLKKFTRCFRCSKCKKLFQKSSTLSWHDKVCKEAKVRHIYPGRVYSPTLPLRKEFEEYEIDLPSSLRFHPYQIVFDIESYLQETSSAGGRSVAFGQTHQPLSVSVVSNVPGYEEPVCLITDGDSQTLVNCMLEHMEAIAQKSRDILSKEAKSVFEKIVQALDSMKQVDDNHEKHPLHALKKKLEDFLKSIPVIGFSSGRYDLNVLKPYLFQYSGCAKHVIKRGSQFLCLTIKGLKFLDIQNYIAPGFSYAEYLKAYGAEGSKMHFPYEWMTSPDKLKHPGLPPKEAFDSKLTGSTLTEQQYAECERLWNANRMKTFKDWLVFYNNSDVVPFLSVIEKQKEFFKEKDLDMFYDGVSLPGLTIRYLFSVKEDNAYFTLFSEKQKDLCHKLWEDLVGGPSLVFHRQHVQGLTEIRPAEKEMHPHKMCGTILGYDANSLYLCAIGDPQPTGYPGIRRAEEGFQLKQYKPQSKACLEWFEYLKMTRGVEILHAGNRGRDRQIGGRKCKVDGVCGSRVFEFDGCYFHNHTPCRLNPRGQQNDVGRRKAEMDKEKRQYLKKLGYNVTVMRECEWAGLKQTNKDAAEAAKKVSGKQTQAWKPESMDEETIKKMVKSGELFGIVECDLETPRGRKNHFKEFCPIFKNCKISKEDIGPYMESFAKEHNLMKEPRRSLISSYHAKKMMIITPLLQWYLKMGLRITKIHRIIQYRPSSCFQNFVDEVTKARREADVDPDKAVIAQTMKAIGNSSYGKTVTNKSRWVDVKFLEGETAQQAVSNPFFLRMAHVGQNYEVTFRKRSISYDLPMQIGFFVYGYAKLRLLKFYYEFLDYYVDRRDFQLVQCDTDSLYFAISGKSLEEVVKPELKKDFQEKVKEWLPSETCPKHRGDEDKSRQCCLDHKKHQLREPGLWKLECQADKIIALCSKTYICSGPKGDKTAAKGVIKTQNDLRYDRFEKTLSEKKDANVVNRGIRLDPTNGMRTYAQRKVGLSYLYPKRRVLKDGVSTIPLDL